MLIAFLENFNTLDNLAQENAQQEYLEHFDLTFLRHSDKWIPKN